MSGFTCPCCRQLAPDDAAFLYDPDSGWLTTARGRARISPVSHRAIMEKLVAARGKVVTRDSLIQAIYWDRDEPEDADGVLKVHLCKLRRVVAHTGLDIETSWGRGYRIDPKQTIEPLREAAE